MTLLSSGSSDKPNRLELDSKYKGSVKDKSEEYHLDYAKWCLTNSQNHLRSKWLASIKVNKNFYKGNQWIFDEDVEAFLKDETGQTKNRIKVVNNLIRPLVEQYRGNAIRLQINASVKSISARSVNRRETLLGKKIFQTRAANEFPTIGAIQKENDPSIGDTVQETTDIFNNLYVDDYVLQMNKLLRYVSELNEFSEMQTRVAQNMALSGLGVTYGFHHGGHQRFNIIESESFVFDRNARRYDLTDAAYQGDINNQDPSTIFETHQDIKHDHRKSIEKYVSGDAANSQYSDTETGRNVFAGSNVPVVRMYWRDYEKYEYGWVLDEAGYPYLVRINHIAEGETEAKYTDQDLIDPPSTLRNKRLFKNGKKKRNLYVDVLRYCKFIPGEWIGTEGEDKKPYDIPLEFGLSPYQEVDYLDFCNVKYPYKAYCWGYVDGEIFSPVDDAINPQRFSNRVLSVTESQINNSGGANIVIDEDTLPSNDPSDAYRDIAQGKPVTLRTKGRGVPNSIGVYDATPKQGTYRMFDIIPVIKGFIDSSTGINDPLRGESTGPDQLVGVTDALIQRGSLMQEPFYHAIARIFVQMFQHTATVGKNMYIESERELAIAVGDDGVEVLKLSKDMANEDFRAFVTRENTDAILQQQANQQLMLFKDMQLIDEITFADLYDRSTPSEVTRALRKSIGAKAESQRRQAKEASAQEQAQNEQIQAAQQQEQANIKRGETLAVQKDISDKNHDLDKIFAKGLVDASKEKGNPGASI